MGAAAYCQENMVLSGQRSIAKSSYKDTSPPTSEQIFWLINIEQDVFVKHNFHARALVCDLWPWYLTLTLVPENMKALSLTIQQLRSMLKFFGGQTDKQTRQKLYAPKLSMQGQNSWE